MDQLIVPDLRSKLTLLVYYGGYNDRAEIAAELGRSKKTVFSWADGYTGRSPGHIPPAAAQAFLKLYQEALPTDLSLQAVADLLRGSTVELERSLQGIVPTLEDLIAREGSSATAALLTPAGFNLIETRAEAQRRIKHQVDLKQWFRIVFRANLPYRHILALQLTKTQCGRVGASLAEGDIHVPGIGSDGTYEDMREINEEDVHTFAAFQTRRSIPPGLAAQPLFDPVARDGLVRFYLTNSVTERRIYFLKVKIGNRDK